jgi:hypothetical protein
MSSVIHPDVPSRIRCEAILSSTSQNLACHRPHGAVLRYPRTGRLETRGDDPALLIGLALGHVRQGDGLTGKVPEMVLARLQAHADTGNPACRLLLDWLGKRNCDLVASIPLCSGRRKIRERRQAGPGSLKMQRPKTTHPSGSNAAIIAAKTEGRINE